MIIYFDNLKFRTKKGILVPYLPFLTIASNSEKGQSNVEITNVLGIKKKVLST